MPGRKTNNFLKAIQMPFAKVRKFIVFLLLILMATACNKNNVSPIPNISLKAFGPGIFKLSTDTLSLYLSITDGDADLGNDPNLGLYDIYIRDFRFDSNYVGYTFPEISKDIQDPKKGITALCLFEFFSPNIINARTDSVHLKVADTTHFEIYIMDKAGHKSNHILTPEVIMLP